MESIDLNLNQNQNESQVNIMGNKVIKLRTSNILVYEEDGIDCLSLNECADEGWVIEPTKILNTRNKPIIENGKVLDILIPITDLDLNFKKIGK